MSVWLSQWKHKRAETVVSLVKFEESDEVFWNDRCEFYRVYGEHFITKESAELWLGIRGFERFKVKGTGRVPVENERAGNER